MRLGLDTSALDPAFKAHAHRGIGRYVRMLSGALENLSSPSVEVHRYSYKDLELPGMVESAIRLAPFGRQTIRQQVAGPLRLRAPGGVGVSAVHIPAHMDAPAWSPVPVVLTLLDLIPFIFSDLYQEHSEHSGWRFHFARMLERRAITSARLILAISECTKRDATRMLHIPPERIVVTPLGVDESFFSLERRPDDEPLRAELGIPLGRRIVMYLGGIDRRKNTDRMLEAFARLQAVRSDVQLVCIGKISQDADFPRFTKAIEALGLSGAVSLPGFVEDAKVKRLFAIADVFFFPSLYEGFGLPVLEALAGGVPVVASNASSIPEVSGPAGRPLARLVSPVDPAAMAAALVEVLALSSEKLSLVSGEGRAHARSYTWDRTARLTMAAYEQLAAEVSR